MSELITAALIRGEDGEATTVLREMRAPQDRWRNRG
jgi:hypothetical protein